jgi:hypothetical protein
VAVEVIGNIAGPEAMRLRADILWAANHWREAAEQIELIYGERWQDFEPLTDSERTDILRGAIGYALADDSIGLARFREKYAAKIDDGPDRRAFEVVTAPIDTSAAEFREIARAVSALGAKTAVLDGDCRLLSTAYVRIKGDPQSTLLAQLRALSPQFGSACFRSNGPPPRNVRPITKWPEVRPPVRSPSRNGNANCPRCLKTLVAHQRRPHQNQMPHIRSRNVALNRSQPDNFS